MSDESVEVKHDNKDKQPNFVREFEIIKKIGKLQDPRSLHCSGLDYLEDSPYGQVFQLLLASMANSRINLNNNFF